MTTAMQVRLTQLRAGLTYEISVATNGSDGLRQSEWATAPLLRTDTATHAPEPPRPPNVLPTTDCKRVRLRLPEADRGCRSPTEASLQIFAMHDGKNGWVDSDEPIVSSEFELTTLPRNASYRFRLVAHNAAGRSHPGGATPAVHVCSALPAARQQSPPTHWSALLPTFVQSALGVDNEPPSTILPQRNSTHSDISLPLPMMTILSLVPVALCLACAMRLAHCSPVAGRRQRVAKGGRYQKAATSADSEDDSDEEPALPTPTGGGAWNRPEALLCVHVFVPASRKPVQIEMSTAGIGSSAKLLRQLLVVVSEVVGRHAPPLSPEELSVVYEVAGGGSQLLHSRCVLNDVLQHATRITASIRDSASAFQAQSAGEASWPAWRTSI